MARPLHVELEGIAAMLLPARWRLEARERELPEGRTRDVVEVALLALNAAAESLKTEAAELARWPEEERG